ncbi:AAA family ATPase [Paenibacillus larvae]|uniref:AAA family ATPase n=1 Tax=Paenibacillus larvae TaxID=1464 RepID=UPI002282A145|nr:AAA family ATPase [Paenibacillus larvae]MCY9749085.1 AAA family ATPase [Paenibacillus larvae]
MKFFLCIRKEGTYKKIDDHLRGEHTTSRNLTTYNQFIREVQSGLPDFIVIDPKIDFYEKILESELNVPIIQCTGSFSTLFDEISETLSEMMDQDYEEDELFETTSDLLEPEEDSGTAKVAAAQASSDPDPIVEEPTYSEFDLAEQEEDSGTAKVAAAQASSDPDPVEEPAYSEFDLAEQEEDAAAGETVTKASKAKELRKKSDPHRKKGNSKTKEIRLSNVIAVWSPTGGTGKTEIALNLALHMAKSLKVALVDFNTVNPDVGYALGINFPQGKTIYNAYYAYLEKNLSYSRIEQHFSDFFGVKVLSGVPDVITSSDLSSLFFVTLLKTLKRYFDVVIVDMSSDLKGPAGINILSTCNRIIVPITSELRNLAHTKSYISMLQNGGIELETIEFVLNKHNEGGSVNEALIIEKLKKKPIGSLPFHKIHMKANDGQKPVYLSGYKPMETLCKKISEPYEIAIKKGIVPITKSDVSNHAGKSKFRFKLPSLKELKLIGGKKA